MCVRTDVCIWVCASYLMQHRIGYSCLILYGTEYIKTNHFKHIRSQTFAFERPLFKSLQHNPLSCGVPPKKGGVSHISSTHL